ncbi:riboflavin kinase [Lachnoclostridium sp.]|nr:riboflavin kinase [Lachnoclostridium sp.]
MVITMENLNIIKKMQNTYVAFGSFEGVHKGHLAVIEELVKRGKKDGRTTVAVSCYSPSRQIEMGVLTTEEEKAYLLEKTGLDILISYNMDEAIASGNMVSSTEEFIKKIILGELGARLIVTGDHYKDMNILADAVTEVGADIAVVKMVKYGEEELTSELVRKSFMECKFEEVTQMCGHTYIMIGEVVHGKALGRTVGMPTANLGVAGTKLKPPSGVYATRTIIEDETYQGLTNIGTRPSVDDLPIITIETFLLDFSKDIYGKKLKKEVHFYIRGVQKFNNLDEVQNQVQKDLAQVKDYLGTLL